MTPRFIGHLDGEGTQIGQDQAALMVLYCANRILMIKFIKFPQLTRCHRNSRYERSINSSNRHRSCPFSSPIKAYLQCISSYNGSKIFYNCLTNTACFFLDTEILLYKLSLHFCCQIAINKTERKMKFCIFIQTLNTEWHNKTLISHLDIDIKKSPAKAAVCLVISKHYLCEVKGNCVAPTSHTETIISQRDWRKACIHVKWWCICGEFGCIRPCVGIWGTGIVHEVTSGTNSPVSSTLVESWWSGWICIIFIYVPFNICFFSSTIYVEGIEFCCQSNNISITME